MMTVVPPPGAGATPRPVSTRYTHDHGLKDKRGNVIHELNVDLCRLSDCKATPDERAALMLAGAHSRAMPSRDVENAVEDGDTVVSRTP